MDNKHFLETITRRSFLITAGQTALCSTLVARMYYLQILENQKYHDMAEGNRIDLRFIVPARGRIFSRDGVPIIDNRPNYRVIMSPYEIRSVDESLQALQKLLHFDDEHKKKLKQFVKMNQRLGSIPLFENMTWEDFSKVAQNIYTVPGIDIDQGLVRYYPVPFEFCHLTGYTGTPNEKEKESNSIFDIHGMKIGKNGIEKILDDRLRGTAGTIKVEVNHLGRPVRQLDKVEAVSGEDIHLHLDSRLQHYARTLLKEETGSVCLVRIKDAALLTMVSTPGFDPNHFIRGLSHAEWNELINSERFPLSNKAISGQYPPGSTVKMVTALAALESGVIDEHTRVFCPGHLRYGKAKFHCWKKGGHGSLNVQEAIKHSCDVFFYDVALKTGIKKLAETYHALGMGEKTGIELPNEKAGLVATPEWKKKNYKTSWYPADTIISAIGQGSMLMTPLQLALMTAELASGKRIPALQLIDNKQEFNFEKLPFAEKHLHLVREGMFRVVNDRDGTAYAAHLPNPMWQMAGKTGTAQVRRISTAERLKGVLKNENIAWKMRDHALFVGFAPYHNPEFAVSVVVEHGSSGSKTASPIARDLLNKALELMPPAPMIPPSDPSKGGFK